MLGASVGIDRWGRGVASQSARKQRTSRCRRFGTQRGAARQPGVHRAADEVMKVERAITGWIKAGEV